MTRPKRTDILEQLFTKLDEEALAIFSEIKKINKEATDEEGILIGFGERARVFAEISKYAFERQKMAPSKPAVESRFNAIKRELHGGGERNPSAGRAVSARPKPPIKSKAV